MRGDTPNKILVEQTTAFNDIHNLIYNEFDKLDENRVRLDIGPKIRHLRLTGEDILRLRMGGTFVPINRYSNVSFIAKEAALSYHS